MKTAPLYADEIASTSVSSSYWVQARDGVKLRIAAWRPEVSGNGTVLIFPGRTDFIEKLSHVAVDLSARGYSSLVIDWRGQGLSDRLTQNRIVSHVVRFSDYQSDVEAMIEAAERLDMPKPWYLLGYSMGATIGLRSLVDGLKVDACAFTAPSPARHSLPCPESRLRDQPARGRTTGKPVPPGGFGRAERTR